jgi:hypothetical protein
MQFSKGKGVLEMNAKVVPLELEGEMLAEMCK